MISYTPKRLHSIDRHPLLFDEVENSTSSSTLKKMEQRNLTDSQKLDCLLKGFQRLEIQYKEIKEEHEILRDECQNLKHENNRLKQALLSMSNGSGNEYLKCEDLLQEIVELKMTISNGRDELEVYKKMLEESNNSLRQAVNSLRNERDRKCDTFFCRFLVWVGLKK